MRQNLWEFSAAKVHRLVGELNTILYDNGQKRTWKEFQGLAQNITDTFHGNWLQAEYNHSVASTQMAIKWSDVLSRADALPMLRYITAKDERVRDSHAKLHGTTLPISDPFWDSFYPPNGYNCRCSVQQVAGPEKQPEEIPADIPATMSENPGKTQRVFSDKHPYFQNAKDYDLTAWVAQEAAYISVYDLIYSPKGKGSVLAHPAQNHLEQAQNEEVARRLADSGEKVTLMSWINEDGVKNPDAKVGRRLADFKHPNGASHSSIQNSLRRAVRQGVELAVLYFPDGYDAQALRRALLAGRSHGYFDRLSVWVVTDGSIRKMSAKALRDGKLPANL